MEKAGTAGRRIVLQQSAAVVTHVQMAGSLPSAVVAVEAAAADVAVEAAAAAAAVVSEVQRQRGNQ